MGGKGEFCRVVTNEARAFLSFFNGPNTEP